jgi:hypothetical protein
MLRGFPHDLARARMAYQRHVDVRAEEEDTIVRID